MMKSNSPQQNILLENLFQSQQVFLTILRSSESLPFLSSYFLSCSILYSTLFFSPLLFSSLLYSTLLFSPLFPLLFTFLHFSGSFPSQIQIFSCLYYVIDGSHCCFHGFRLTDYLTKWLSDSQISMPDWLIYYSVL